MISNIKYENMDNSGDVVNAGYGDRKMMNLARRRPIIPGQDEEFAKMEKAFKVKGKGGYSTLNHTCAQPYVYFLLPLY